MSAHEALRFELTGTTADEVTLKRADLEQLLAEYDELVDVVESFYDFPDEYGRPVQDVNVQESLL